MTEKSDLKRSFENHPISWMYFALGLLTMFLGIFVMDGYLELAEDMALYYVYGFSVTVFGGSLVIVSNLFLKIDKLHEKIRRIEREELLQDLQQEK